MGGLLHLVQRGGNWAGPQPAQAPPCCTKCNSPPINGQCRLPIAVLLYNDAISKCQTGSCRVEIMTHSVYHVHDIDRRCLVCDIISIQFSTTAHYKDIVKCEVLPGMDRISPACRWQLHQAISSWFQSENEYRRQWLASYHFLPSRTYLHRQALYTVSPKSSTANSRTLSILNGFSKFFNAEKRSKFPTKSI